MKDSKVIWTLVGAISAVALTFGAAALASPNGQHARGWSPEKMQQHFDDMVEQLSLSDAQETQIRATFDEAKARAEEIKEMPRGPEKFEAFRDLYFTTEDAIYANLTCEQREELRLLRRERRAEKMQERWERHQGRRASQTTTEN